jgi:hypothetical protein
MTTATFTAFRDHRLLATGALADVARAVAAEGGAAGVVIFEDATGRVVDLDPRLLPDAAAQAWQAAGGPTEPEPAPRQGPGRPRLGVVAREVTLLPRHWDWLAAQRGGASATLRRLIDEARRDAEPADRARRVRDAAYRAMATLAGDLPDFEEASRALFAGDQARLAGIVAEWPSDVSAYVLRLAAAGPAA